LSAWFLKNWRLAANEPEEHSETACMTDRAIVFLSALGCPSKRQSAEGRDQTLLLHGTDGFSRCYAISEHDSHWSEMARTLNQPQEDAHTKMIFDGRWNCNRCAGFRPFDSLAPVERTD